MAAELEAKKSSWVESTREYLNDIRAEMRRVTWPNRKQVESTTLVVIVSVFAFAAYFEIIDKILQSTVQRGYNFLVK
ncbi:MAG TPA: preprotein translocase subunit SecE [Bryobacteraceae bacterium]|jgi:preprotein translocase subunit SecE|nr:preprotein translocase subunit SecE [Bryobacteraceae bacterium]